ncbi:MAG: helix-turn-helix domain-containing protein [Thermodesulfobacteriota bacterium]
MIGKRLKKIRKDKGITQKGLADKIEGKMDYTYIGKIERGEQLPSLKILKKIADALHVSLNYFFYDEKASTPSNFIPKDVLEIARDEKKGKLLRTLNTMHETDIPFILEVANILKRHREISGKPNSISVEEKRLPMVAEEVAEYGRREGAKKLTNDIENILRTEVGDRVKDVLKRVLNRLKRE